MPLLLDVADETDAMDTYIDNDLVQEECSAVLNLRRQAKDPEGATTHRERGRLPPVAADLLQIWLLTSVVLEPIPSAISFPKVSRIF